MSAIANYKQWTGAERAASLAKTKAAIAAKIIPPASKCKICGQTDGIIQYHNEDYSDPIKYLRQSCWRCHMMHHSERRATETVKAYFDAVRAEKRFPPVHKHDFGILAKDHGVM
jgi:hypothetical protein